MAFKFGKNATSGSVSKGEPHIERFQPDTKNGLVIPEISVTQTGSNHGSMPSGNSTDSGSFYDSPTTLKKRKGGLPQGNH